MLCVSTKKEGYHPSGPFNKENTWKNRNFRFEIKFTIKFTTGFPTLSGGSISHKKIPITIPMNIPLNPMFYGHPEVGTPGSLHVQQHMHLEAPVTGFHHEDLAAVAWETRPEDSESRFTMDAGWWFQQPLWKMMEWVTVGMMTFPIWWEKSSTCSQPPTSRFTMDEYYFFLHIFPISSRCFSVFLFFNVHIRSTPPWLYICPWDPPNRWIFVGENDDKLMDVGVSYLELHGFPIFNGGHTNVQTQRLAGAFGFQWDYPLVLFLVPILAMWDGVGWLLVLRLSWCL